MDDDDDDHRHHDDDGVSPSSSAAAASVEEETVSEFERRRDCAYRLAKAALLGRIHDCNDDYEHHGEEEYYYEEYDDDNDDVEISIIPSLVSLSDEFFRPSSGGTPRTTAMTTSLPPLPHSHRHGEHYDHHHPHRRSRHRRVRLPARDEGGTVSVDRSHLPSTCSSNNSSSNRWSCPHR